MSRVRAGSLWGPGDWRITNIIDPVETGVVASLVRPGGKHAKRLPRPTRLWVTVSRAAHGLIFQSWSKKTTTNEAKNNTYA